MAQKYYVVWSGRQTGVFSDWSTCKSHIDGFQGARYKSFPTKTEADAAFSGTGSQISPSKTFSNSTTLGKPLKQSIVKTHNASEVALIKADIKLFTDGGCEPNPGQAGSGLALYRKEVVTELWYGIYNPNGTNNTAELNALYQAMMMAEVFIRSNQSVAIFCDSKYAIQCIIQWADGWKKKGWKKPSGEIKNLDLIKEMHSLYLDIKSKVSILHVNGHVGVEGNELADRMSILAIQTKQGGFVKYNKAIDVPTILAMRVG